MTIIQMSWYKWQSWWRLPSAYQEVEYIEGSWTQYIDTWISSDHPTWLWEREMKYNNLWTKAVDREQYIWWDDAVPRVYYQNWSTYTMFALGNSRRNCGSWTFANTDIVLAAKSSWLLVNGDSRWSYSPWPRWTLWFYVFSAAIDNRPASMKLYYLKMWSDGVLVRDFVPCYRKADNVIWLYDLATDTFYTNAWSWVFSKWSNV